MDTSIEFLIRAGQQAKTGNALREFAQRRLSLALRRFAHRVRQVMFRLVDENVEASAVWPFSSITRATHRLNESIRRELGRHAGRGRESATARGHQSSRELGSAS